MAIFRKFSDIFSDIVSSMFPGKSYRHNEKGQIKKRKLILRSILIIALFFLLILNLDVFRKFAVLSFFIIINFALAFIKRNIPLSFVKKYLYGFELILICTIASGIRFGQATGAIMGLILITVNYLGENRASEYFIITLVLYPLIGYLSYLFRLIDIFQLGIIAAIIYNALAFFFSKLIGANTVTLAVFCVVNVIYNAFLFFAYGSFFLLFLA